MATRVYDILGSRWPAIWCAAAAFLVSGCVTMDDRARAVEAINKVFRTEYEAILVKDGTRVFPVSRAEAYHAVRISMARLGMTIEAQDPALGYVNVSGPAPRPLSDEEWKQAADADRPLARNIIGPHVGLLKWLFDFEPGGLQSVINATVVEVPVGTAISFTARTREIAPPQTGFPRREYLPPTAVRMALAKMWRDVELEFKATVRRP